MSDQTKLLIHFIVSKLVILAVPLMNNLLALVGITVSTSSSTTDALANGLCIALGLAYSYWTKVQSEKVHTASGVAKGVQSVTATAVTVLSASDASKLINSLPSKQSETQPLKPTDAYTK